MSHFETVLNLGYDYGADGGPEWDTQIVTLPSGRTLRNQRRSIAPGSWQLGDRRVNVTQYQYLVGFFHAMRGQLHSFLYKDWNDYVATDEPLTVDGSSTTQLTRTYGSSINPYVRDIVKPKASTVVIERRDGSGEWEELTVDEDYELDAGTGIITWLGSDPPNEPTEIRWSGEFYVRARFDRDKFDAQFIAATPDGDAFYEMGALGVIEDLE